uniref:Uncharacterized protein n=1 Tax=Arundo donax TaxID=35708 RepID=A0A0A9EDM9_ARUDO
MGASSSMAESVASVGGTIRDIDIADWDGILFFLFLDLFPQHFEASD